MHNTLPQWYTRIIGIFFTLIIFSLVSDYLQFGFRPETMHKVFHVALGLLIIILGWKSETWWKIFPAANGAFFSYVALFGWLFPDFGGLDTFNTADTILHTIVGVSGLIVAAISYRK